MTTEQTIAAIQAAPYRAQTLPLEAVLSLPVPVLEGSQVLLAFFWCSMGGPIQNRTVSTPYCRTVADLQDPSGLVFQPVEPHELGVEVPRTAAFGKTNIGGSIPAAEMKQTRADFYSATDRILALYARTTASPNLFLDERELAETAAYREAFHRLAVVALLPVYLALSPGFFAWLDGVLGPRTGQPLD